MGFLQDAHLDPGKTMDSFLGILYMHTLRKLPIIKPNITTNKYVISLQVYKMSIV